MYSKSMETFKKTLGYEPLTMKRDGVTIYGLHAYGSMFDMRVNKGAKPYITQTQRVYNFKKRGACKGIFAELVRRFAECMNAKLVIAIPSSSVERLSSLQEEFGVTLRRTKNSEQRKYHHNRPVNDTGKVILEVDVFGKNVVLLDDIVTTGASMLFFVALLKKAGAASVYPLGLGLSFAKAYTCPTAEEVEETVERIRSGLDDEEGSGLEDLLNNAVEDLYDSLSGTSQVALSGTQAEELILAAKRMKMKPNELLSQIVRKYLDTLPT